MILVLYTEDLMKLFRNSTLLSFAITGSFLAGVIGCGGSGSGTTSTSVGTGGNSANSLSAQMTINGGVAAAAYGVGVQTVQTVDGYGNTLVNNTFTNVNVITPIGKNDSFIIVRKGSVLLSGTYTSTTCTAGTPGSTPKGTFLVDSNGVLGQDIAFDCSTGQYAINLPISSAAGLKFNAPVELNLAYGLGSNVTGAFQSVIANSSDDKTVTISGSVSTTQTGTSGGQPTFGTETVNISGAPNGEVAYVAYVFANATTNAKLTGSQQSGSPLSVVFTNGANPQGTAIGTNSFTEAAITYNF